VAAFDALTDLSRRRKGWRRRQDPTETEVKYRFSTAALNVASAYAFFQEHSTGRGFPPLTQYIAFAKQLEAHRESLKPRISEEMRRALITHTDLQDYNGGAWGHDHVPVIKQWIAEQGHLPRPMVTYRQESRAWATSTASMKRWDQLRKLNVGDIMSWDDRPLSTSLDPGFTRLMSAGWGDQHRWGSEAGQLHFMITATRGYYLGAGTTMARNEHELILAPGQKYRVLGFEQHRTDNMLGMQYGGGQHRMYVVLEEEGPA